jgi:molybdenum cofactor cytidylyltransferase
MFFGEVKTGSSLGGILSSSIEIYKNKNKIKISKGTVISKKLIDLLLSNKVEHIECAKLDDDEIDENSAVHQISKKIITSKKSNIKIQYPKNGRCNLVSSVDGIIIFQPNQLFYVNSVTNDIGIASLKAFSKVKKNQVVASIKAIPFGIKKNNVRDIINISKDCFKVLPFQKKNIHLIQTTNQNTRTKILEKTLEVTKDRLSSCGIKKIIEKNCSHEIKSICAQLQKSIDEDADIILIFGTSAISDINDIIPQSIIEINGTILRLGMPVEPGNLILLANIKNSKKHISIIGMPGCARSKKENGVDWILWRKLCDLKISSDDINHMGNGGLL